MSRSMRTAYLVAVASASLLLVACGTEDDAGTDAGPTQTAAETPTAEEPTMTDDARPTPIPVPTPTDDALPAGPVDSSVLERDEVKAAIAAEAQRRDVAEDEVEVTGYASVTWTDGSLGCPQPGMFYTQALVPGEQLILEVAGERASYHAGRDGQFSYCADPIAPAPGNSGGAPTM